MIRPNGELITYDAVITLNRHLIDNSEYNGCTRGVVPKWEVCGIWEDNYL